MYSYIHDSNSSSDDADFEPEKVVFRRSTKGKPQYYIKWKGRDESNNTWESKESAYCHDLIEEYEKQRARDKTAHSSKPSTSASVEKSKNHRDSRCLQSVSSRTTRKSVDSRASGSEKKERHSAKDKLAATRRKTIDSKASGSAKYENVGKTINLLKAKKVLGASLEENGLQFYIEFQDDIYLIPAAIANKAIPQLVIKYYEQRVVWTT